MVQRSGMLQNVMSIRIIHSALIQLTTGDNNPIYGMQMLKAHLNPAQLRKGSLANECKFKVRISVCICCQLATVKADMSNFLPFFLAATFFD